MSMGKQVPDSLIRQIEEDKQKEIKSDSFNNFGNNTAQQQQQQQQPHFQQPRVQQPPNKYSPQYATFINAKPRAQASAKIRLGGVFN